MHNSADKWGFSPGAGGSVIQAQLDAFTHTERKLLHTLSSRAKTPRLGEILLEAGYVAEEELALALERLRTTGRRVGQELLALGALSHEHVFRALRIQRWLLAAALIAAFTPGYLAPADAAEAQATMQVSAMIVASTNLRQLYQAQQIEITTADLTRGYIEIPAASRLEVRADRGVAFDFHPSGTMFSGAMVSDGTDSYRFGPAGGVIVRTHAPSIEVTFSYRFDIAPGVAPGIYPWPLMLTVLPL